MTCTHLEELLETEMQELKTEIDKHKYLRSEQEHKDIGYPQAKEEFLEHYFIGWAKGFRKCYCSKTCEYRNECDIEELQMWN